MLIKDKIINWSKDFKLESACIVRGMPSEVYHVMPGLSTSGIKELLKCPQKYYYKYLSGKCEQKTTPTLEFGKACHKYILEGQDKFFKEYCCDELKGLLKEEIIKIIIQRNKKYDIKELNKYSKPYLELIWHQQEKIDTNLKKISKNDFEKIQEMDSVLKQNRKIKNALGQEGEAELSLFWQDEKTGIWLKCRPDFLPYNPLNVPDYKTAQSVEPIDFYNAFINYGYHIQAAMYRMGIKAVCDVDVMNFFFIAQEKEAPYIAQLYCPDDYLINHGEKAVQTAIEKYIKCKESNQWGTYCDSVIELRVEPKPEEIPSRWDSENAICYAPNWLDSVLERSL